MASGKNTKWGSGSDASTSYKVVDDNLLTPSTGSRTPGEFLAVDVGDEVAINNIRIHVPTGNNGGKVTSNLLAPGRCGSNSKIIIYKVIVQNDNSKQ